MAIMYPDIPHPFDAKSREDIMFDCLKKLPDDYYVFHSFKIVKVIDNVLNESEADFVIFNPQKGILCLEAKAGQVCCEEGTWKYSNGKPMSHGGPYRQAADNKWDIVNYIRDNKLDYLLKRCKLLHGVWFPSIDDSYLERITLPTDADRAITLTSSAFENIEKAISNIFDIELKKNIFTNLNDDDVSTLINSVFAPQFDLIPLKDLKRSNQQYVFKRMLNEQTALLNYLEEQNSAVINGLAGTGKTVMALEKARRNSLNGDQVLFLCYNAYLKEYLKSNYPYDNVNYYTIDGLACKLCNTSEPDYDLLSDKLIEMYSEDSFPYKHIIIDEGQDFGKDRIDDQSIIQLLKENVVSEDKDGTFYLFYDKNQMIQSQKLPEYISDADCRLTLYKNCRNTQNIATSSLRLLKSQYKPKLFEGAVVGDSPEMYFAYSEEEIISTLNYIIKNLLDDGYDNICILTDKTEEKSIISSYCKNGFYKYKSNNINFTTCRKFKGLEADAIILIDVDMESFSENSELLMYVGSSRARYKLYFISSISEDDCNNIVETVKGKKARKPKKEFSTLYNAKFKEIK